MQNFITSNLQRPHVQEAIKKAKEIAKHSLLFFILAIAIIISTIVMHTLPKIEEFKNIKKEIEIKKEEIEQAKIDKREVKEELQTKKEQLSSYEKKLAPKIKIIFPQKENIFELTKFLEDYAIRFNSESNPMVLNNISFGEATQTGEYFTLPVRMNLSASAYNFKNFLTMIQNSGSLDEKKFFRNNPVRLMSVESINLTVPKEDEEEAKNKSKDAEVSTYSFNLELNAFFKGGSENENTKKK